MLALPSGRLEVILVVSSALPRICTVLVLHVGSAAGQGLLSASQNPFAPVVLLQKLPGAKISPFPSLPTKTELSLEPGCTLTPKSWPCGLSSVTPGHTFLLATPRALPAKGGCFPWPFPQSWSLSLQKPWLSTSRLNFQAELSNLPPHAQPGHYF